MGSSKISKQLTNRMIKKASQSICSFQLCAFGFNRNGDCVASASNRPRFPHKGGGWHAERQIMELKSKGIVKILICRINPAGKMLPIDPCETCQKIADKLGIKIISIKE